MASVGFDFSSRICLPPKPANKYYYKAAWSFTVIGNKRCSAMALHSTQHEGEGGEKGWRMFVVVFVLWIFCLQGHSLCSAGQAQCKNHKKNLPWIKNEQLFKIPFFLFSWQHAAQQGNFSKQASKVLTLYKMQSLTCSAFTWLTDQLGCSTKQQCLEHRYSPRWPSLTSSYSNEFSSCLPCRTDQP